MRSSFDTLYGVFAIRSYDSLDPTDMGFIKDYEKFNANIFALDRRLGAILASAFDDGVITESIFKLLQIFGSLIKRKLIAQELSDKMPHLIVMLNEEMDVAKAIFLKQQKRVKDTGRPQCDRNMPPISGQLRFSQELRDKIANSVRNFRELQHPISAGPGGEMVVKKYKDMVCLLTSYEEAVFKAWVQAADKKTMEGLSRPLLVRDTETQTVSVNFGRDTLAILNEVKYLNKDFPDREVPDKAKEIFRRFDDFRNYNNSLEQTVSLYNYLKKHTVAQEYALIEEEVADLDIHLNLAETGLNWNSEELAGTLENIRRRVSDLNTRVKKAQANITLIKAETQKWEGAPLICRKKPGALLELEGREEHREKRYTEIRQASTKIQDILEENNRLFKVAESGASQRWGEYLGYLDSMVEDGLLRAVAVSLGYLLDETDVKRDVAALFTARLELSEPDIIFRPSLDLKMSNNFFDVVTSLIEDIFNMAGLVPRIAKAGVGENYLSSAQDHLELKAMKSELVRRVNMVMEMANQRIMTYMKYSYLWTESRNDTMFYFLQWGRQLTPDELELFAEDPALVKKEPPTLKQFKEQIDKYEAIYDSVKEMEDSKRFQSWFLADITPFKMALLNGIKKWSYAFKKHLLEHVVDSLQDLSKFIVGADEGLIGTVVEGDYKGLIRVMEYLAMVKEKQAATDSMFDPLKNVIDLLRSYGVEIPQVSRSRSRSRSRRIYDIFRRAWCS